MRPARSRGSAAAASTATTRSRARSSAAASSPAEPRASVWPADSALEGDRLLRGRSLAGGGLDRRGQDELELLALLGLGDAGAPLLGGRDLHLRGLAGLDLLVGLAADEL